MSWQPKALRFYQDEEIDFNILCRQYSSVFPGGISAIFLVFHPDRLSHVLTLQFCVHRTPISNAGDEMKLPTFEPKSHSLMQIMEIKRLNDALACSRSELMRTEERLEDAKKLQKFLHDLTPQEWMEGLVQERDDRHAVKMAEWQAACNSIAESILVSQWSCATSGFALKIVKHVHHCWHGKIC